MVDTLSPDAISELAPGSTRLAGGPITTAEQQRQSKSPMEAAEYRRVQATGMRSEGLNVEERLAQKYPYILRPPGQSPEASAPQAAAAQTSAASKAAAAEAANLDSEADESWDQPVVPQMPAIQESSSGNLVKTIEQYTFSDSEDSVSFVVHFDRDLWDGASNYVDTSRVKVECTATSLEIRLQGLPIGPEAAPEALADWRLALKPLFSRVEPRMMRQRLRKGKLTVTLMKSKVGSWKKGVK